MYNLSRFLMALTDGKKPNLLVDSFFKKSFVLKYFFYYNRFVKEFLLYLTNMYFLINNSKI